MSGSASEMTYIVSGGALNSTHSSPSIRLVSGYSHVLIPLSVVIVTPQYSGDCSGEKENDNGK